MLPPFEVFLSEPDGNVLWRGTAASMDEAKARIRDLAKETPGYFIVMSRRTGHKLRFKCSGDIPEEETVLGTA